MVKSSWILVFFLAAECAFAQVANFQSDFNRINKNLMIGLGSYAASNFVFSGIGYATTDNEQLRRFHEMNVLWNTVNAGLAIPGYLKATRSGRTLSLEEMRRQQQRTETVFLVNGFLDVGYMAAGAWMRNTAADRPGQEALFTGYGNSLLLQGGFLLAFDAFAYVVHHRHGKQLRALEMVTPVATSNGVGLRVQFGG